MTVLTVLLALNLLSFLVSLRGDLLSFDCFNKLFFNSRGVTFGLLF